MSPHVWVWSLSVTRSVTAELRITGEVTSLDIDRLKEQIGLLGTAFEEDQIIAEEEEAGKP